MPFTEQQVNLLDENRGVVEAVRLFHVQFASAEYRLAEGNVPITLAGHEWLPAHNWITAAPIQQSGQLQAVPAVYRVGSLTPDLIGEALNNMSEWWGRPIQQWMQLFSNGAPVGPMVSMHRGLMRDLSMTRQLGQEYLEFRAESPMDARNIAPLGEYTDRDQKRRSANDDGCEFAPSLVMKKITGWLRG